MTATLHVIFGPSGAGKSTYAHSLARRTPAVAFAIDEWVGRLFAADMPEPLPYDWMMDRVQRCEAQIWSTAAAVMAAGASVVLDLGLLRRSDRERVREIAEACGLPLQFHFVTAPLEARRARVLHPGDERRVEVTPDMFAFLERVYEAPEAEELAGCIVSESA